MQLAFTAPPDSLSNAELVSGNWRPLVQPPLWAIRLLALPAGALVGFVVLLAWGRLAPRVELEFAPASQVIGATLAVVVMNVALQLAAHPAFGLSANSVLGFWPSRVVLYTCYLGKVTKTRYLVSLLLPFLLMSVAPLLVATIFRLQSGWLLFVACLTAMNYGPHVLIALFAAAQLPTGALVAGRGIKAFWSLQDRVA